MATIGFALHLLVYRNAQRNGDVYGFKYPINAATLQSMGAIWLTKALRASKTIGDAVEVVSFSSGMPAKKGLMSDLRLLDVVYNIAHGGPTKIMFKFDSGDLKIRGLTSLFGLSYCEFKFYSGEMPARVPMRTPHCYFADMNQWVGNSCVLMEYLEDGEFQDVLDQALTLADAKLIMIQLGRFHAVYHGEGRHHASVDFVQRLDTGPQGTIAPPIILQNIETVRNKSMYAHPDCAWDFEMPAEFTRELYGDESILAYAEHQLLWPDTVGVAHGDCRLDNWFFYNNDDGNRTCGLLDWQVVIKADISQDLAVFFCACEPNFVAKHEQELMDLYFVSLAKAGGPSVLPGSDLRVIWEECYSLSISLITLKNIVGLSQMDGRNDLRIAQQMNIMMKSNFATYTRRGCADVWRKMRKQQLCVQKKYPGVSNQIFAKHPKLRMR
eukprot:m.65585 g.65585  ORF g.65585 m.65585 type:complete len:439 (-) comp23577_c0_seq1:343-1659(-)